MKTVKLPSNYDDLDIDVALCRPVGTPVAVVQLVHGMCGCKDRFYPMMEYFARNGVASIASDLRGHGDSVKSVDDRGYFYSGGYRALVDDIRVVSSWGRQEFSGVPFYLLGHSMGSMATRVYAKQDDSALSGLIVCGSPSKNPMSGFGQFLTGAMCLVGLDKSRAGFLQDVTDAIYNKKFSAEGARAWACSNAQSRAEYKNMPQCNFKFTMNAANNMMKMMRDTYDLNGWSVKNPQMPILFISGADDPCMISKKHFLDSVQSMQRVGYENVSYSVYPKMRHEVLNEIDKHRVWGEILGFVKSR